MHVRVLFFGVLKDWLGAAPATIELPEGASVADLLNRLSAFNLRPHQQPQSLAKALRGIAISVNAEYARVPSCCTTAMKWHCFRLSPAGLPVHLEKSRKNGSSIALTREIIHSDALIPPQSTAKTALWWSSMALCATIRAAANRVPGLRSLRRDGLEADDRTRRSGFRPGSLFGM